MKRHYIKEKFSAFITHLLLSVIVIGLFLVLVKQLWYPGSLFSLENVWDGLKILIPVDAILGPLLTLILFVPKKKNLYLDLSIVVSIQVLALAYGGWVIYGQRPVLLTFDVNEFQVVTAAEGVREKIPTKSLFRHSSDRILVAYALPPENKEEVIHFLSSGIAYQKDATRLRPASKYYETIKGAAIPFQALSDVKASNPIENQKAQQLKNSNDNIHLFRLRGSLGDHAIVAIDLKQGQIVEFLNKTLVDTY